MNNCDELRTKLSKVFDELASGAITVEQAAEAANLAGKMINSAKVQVAYYELRKESPTINFLADNKRAE